MNKPENWVPWVEELQQKIKELEEENTILKEELEEYRRFE